MINLIAPGEPGERWLNNTGIVYWQNFTSLVNVCGACFAKHGQIAEIWFPPYHRCCRCYLVAIPPGEYAAPWPDWRELLNNMDESQHDAAVGKYNWMLIDSGTVKWDDVVTRYRVRTLDQVIAREKLTVSELVKAGIPRGVAEAEYARVHTPAHEAFEAKVKEAAKELKKAGLTDDQIAKGFAEQLVPRIMGGVPSAKKPKAVQPTLPGLGMTPQEQIVAANKVLAKIGATESMPSFSTVPDMRAWVKRTFPDAVISDEDWLLLVLAIDAQRRLRKTLTDLGADPDKAMKAMGQ